jgi:hypothetical protein
MKILWIIMALILLLVLAAMGSCAYIAYRAKQKINAVEEAYKHNDVKKLAGQLGINLSAGDNGTRPDSNSRESKSSSSTAPASEALPVAAPVVPVAATGEQSKDWALKYERTEGGPEADLVVRTGDINNLGFGWPKGFDPFSGDSTPPHQWPDPNHIPPGAPDGTDRIMIGSAVVPGGGDGYSGALEDCAIEQQLSANGPLALATAAQLEGSCKHARHLTMPAPIILSVGALPAKINAVLVQLFADDFQPVPIHSHFQVSLNGTRIPGFEYAVNALDQSGPIGKLLSLNLLPEYCPCSNPER